jgi:predicted PurR-regulated permease PerM
MDFVITAFTVIFTSFFFLKDENMFTNMIIGIVPTRYEDNTKRVLHSVNNLLVRYFTGITLETVCITLLNTTGLYLIGGISFKLAVILAFISGVLNVIPYIGPIFAGLFGIIMSVISLYGGVSDPRLGVLLIKLISIFICTHIIDILVFQPFIYSNSIKAHPLEIFIVILMAGQLGGIFGMLIAIPTYTVLRVFAKEFFNRFKIVRELTDKIE